MRFDLLFPTVKTTGLYLIPRENYSKNTHPSSFLERTIAKLEFETCNISSLHQIGLIGQIMYDVKIYVHQHTKLFLRQIRYKESCFHAKLLRQHRQSSRVNKTVDVYPQIIVDVPHVSLNSHQLDYLSRAGQFA